MLTKEEIIAKLEVGQLYLIVVETVDEPDPRETLARLESFDETGVCFTVIEDNSKERIPFEDVELRVGPVAAAGTEGGGASPPPNPYELLDKFSGFRMDTGTAPPVAAPDPTPPVDPPPRLVDPPVETKDEPRVALDGRLLEGIAIEERRPAEGQANRRGKIEAIVNNKVTIAMNDGEVLELSTAELAKRFQLHN
jgi:hypothetical protein